MKEESETNNENVLCESAHLEKFVDIVNKAVADWVKAEKMDDLKSAAEELSPDQVVGELKDKLCKVEKWYQKKYNAEVKTCCASLKVPSDGWVLSEKASRFLSERSVSQLDRVEASLVNIKKTAIDYVEFLEEHRTVSGLLKDAGKETLRWFYNPVGAAVKAVAEVSGGGPLAEEQKRVEEQLKLASEEMLEAISAFRDRVEKLAVDNWNDNIPDLEEDVREDASGGGSLAARKRSARKSSSRSWSLNLFLMLICFAGGWWGHHIVNGSTSSASPVSNATALHPKSNRRVPIPIGGEIRMGPGESFAVVLTVNSPAVGNVIDDSVPGWLKIRTTQGVKGWIERLGNEGPFGGN